MKTTHHQLITAILLVVILAGCAQPTATQAPSATQPPAATATTGAIVAQQNTPTAAPTVVVSQYNEAPMLADLVKNGKLPAVDKRLPDAPSVITPRESVGKYGGTIHTASWWPGVGNVLLYFATEAPVKWNESLTGYEPALVESYEWSSDGKSFTMHMRKGLKWSDGEPYTSADWKFWWEDLDNATDQKLYNIPAYLRNDDGTPINVTEPDEYTVVWTSKDRPLYIDPYFMAQGYWEFAATIMKPAHYLKQFHPKYTTGKTWDDMQKADQWWQTPGYPCLFAWCLSDLSKDGTSYTYTRNPYYWRVDSVGNQLPYIDKINVEIVADDQIRILNCTQGKYDSAFRICGSPNEIPLLAENAARGNFHLLTGYKNGTGAWPVYMVNQNYVEGGKNYTDDTPEHAKEIHDLFRNASFRQALSIGFDRQRVVDVVWGGIADIQNMTISPQAWHFAGDQGQAEYKKWASAYTEFDAAKANAMLDTLGMKKGTDGMRQLPSGKPFELVIDMTDWGGSLKVQVDSANEMQNQWGKNLSIKVTVNNLQGQPTADTRAVEGYYMIKAAATAEVDILTYPDWMFPVVNRYMFPLEGRYFAKGGASCTDKPSDTSKYPCGIKPDDGSPAKILQDLYVKARNTATIDGRHKVVWEAIDELVKDGPFAIGVAGDQPMPIYIKNNLHNVLDLGVVGPWAPATPGNQVVAQWYFDPPQP